MEVTLVAILQTLMLVCATTGGLLEARPAAPWRHPSYWWVQRQQRHQRLYGPNVCAVEMFPRLGVRYHTECRNWMQPRTVCGQHAVVTYECCVGYAEIKAHPGCLAVATLENVVGTLRGLGLWWLVQVAVNAGLSQELAREGAATVFAPTTKAWQKTSDRLRQQMKSVNGKSPSLLLHHVIDGRRRLADLSHNALYQTQYDVSTLRVTRYKNGMVAVNCARILAPNHEATNGVVHVIDQVLPPGGRGSAADLLSTHKHLVQFTALLERVGLWHDLNATSPVTVFAPTDKAFNRLPRITAKQMKKDNNILRAILQYHIIKDTWCSAGVSSWHQARTLEGSFVNMTCDVDGMRVNNARATRTDLVVNNGVVHLLDQVLFPSKARLLWPLVVDLGLSKLAYFITRVAVNETLADDKPLTLFAPTNDAFNALPAHVVTRLQDDVSFLRQVMTYHVVPGRQQAKMMVSEQSLTTLEGRPARVQVYPWTVAVEAGCIRETDIEAFNGFIHVVDSVLLPPEGTVADIIAKHPHFKILRGALLSTGLVTVFQRPGGFTLFAPTDRAFQNLPSKTRDALLRDPPKLAKILQYHVLGDLHVSCSIRKNLVYPLVTLLGQVVRVRYQGNHLLVENAMVTEADIMATNGVVHVVDSVLYPE